MAIAALLAYLPVSTMLFTLKNDVLAIEYPVLHFISESIRNGESPLWLNTWSMGFPLQGVLSWGVYSSSAIFTGALLPYTIFTLHIVFVLFIILSGWTMFRLLTKHFLPAKDFALLLSCCYMLSGFTVSSSQWLLYLTGMLFIPLVLHCVLNLVKKPGWRNAFFTGLSYLLLLTNVHIYLTVFATYFFVIFIIATLVGVYRNKNKTAAEKKKLLFYVLSAGLITALLCAAPLYYTAEIVAHLERSNPLEENSSFFRSNYLHPEGLKSLFLPLSTVKTTHFNTEGSILNIYMGLLPLLLLPLSLMINFRRHDRKAWVLFSISLFFLVLSFGHLTPLRDWLNIFPGLSYFRHPGVLRIFFIMSFIIYTAYTFRDYKLADLISGTRERKFVIYGLLLLSIIALIVVLLHSKYFPGIYDGSINESIKTVSDGQLILLNSMLQLSFCLLLLITVLKRHRLFTGIVIAELILNFLCCTPFYAVSSYPPAAVDRLLNARKGFPVQTTLPYNVPAEIKGEGETVWRNTNIFKKEVSVNVSMPGPLILEQVHLFLMSGAKEKLSDKALVFINDSTRNGDSLKITEQVPSRVKLRLQLNQPAEIILVQGYFPGWKAFYKGEELSLSKNEFPFVSTIAPAGEGELVFQFEKKGVVYSAILLHIITLLGIVGLLIQRLRLRPASPS